MHENPQSGFVNFMTIFMGVILIGALTAVLSMLSGQVVSHQKASAGLEDKEIVRQAAFTVGTALNDEDDDGLLEVVPDAKALQHNLPLPEGMLPIMIITGLEGKEPSDALRGFYKNSFGMPLGLCSFDYKYPNQKPYEIFVTVNDIGKEQVQIDYEAVQDYPVFMIISSKEKAEFDSTCADLARLFVNAKDNDLEFDFLLKENGITDVVTSYTHAQAAAMFRPVLTQLSNINLTCSDPDMLITWTEQGPECQIEQNPTLAAWARGQLPTKCDENQVLTIAEMPLSVYEEIGLVCVDTQPPEFFGTTIRTETYELSLDAYEAVGLVTNEAGTPIQLDGENMQVYSSDQNLDPSGAKFALIHLEINQKATSKFGTSLSAEIRDNNGKTNHAIFSQFQEIDSSNLNNAYLKRLTYTIPLSNSVSSFELEGLFYYRPTKDADIKGIDPYIYARVEFLE